MIIIRKNEQPLSPKRLFEKLNNDLDDDEDGEGDAGMDLEKKIR